MRRRWLRGCLAACALTLAVPASAQIVAPSLGLGEPVVSQSVAIDARPVSDAALLELIETRVGTAPTSWGSDGSRTWSYRSRARLGASP